MEDKKTASTDKTYCHGIGCNKYRECSRFLGKYNFEKDNYYSFIFNCNDVLFEKDVDNDIYNHIPRID